MEERRQRERELVLAPNEFCYVLDTTKGHINCYVGPNKTSLAQTDQPVIFDELEQRFHAVDLSDATQLFPTATSAGYILLHNPSKNAVHPTLGVSNAMVELRTGEREVVRGPASFPLWPGQIATVFDGHKLRTNQYLLVEIYDAKAAEASWAEATDVAPPESFTIGDRLIIRGTDTSFFIPPTGAQVIPEQSGEFVRSAVTLKRLEYCILVGENGTERYIRGEAVVFPEPSERFYVRGGRKQFRATEVSETVGVHVKVIAPYSEGGRDYVEGEELFITGKDGLYFPRAEHALIRYGDHEVHHAVAIPKGEGRYVLSRSTGEIRLVQGPTMFLADPRDEVITKRRLSKKTCDLLYPGNEDVLKANGWLEDLPKSETRRRKVEIVDDTQSRHLDRSFVPPRSITLDNKFEGAIKVEVWPGYAVQVVNCAGERRVEVGPASILLEYDEELSPLRLSTGTPKSSARRLTTAYLKVAGNRVSDVIEVESSDLVKMDVMVAYRAQFEGDDPGKWFAVDDYVQLVCDHCTSLIKSAARELPIRELRAQITDILRDAVLGPKTEEGRVGRAFTENGMRVYDLEVLDTRIEDEEIADLLRAVRTDSIERAVNVVACEQELHDESRLTEIERQLLQQTHATAVLKEELEAMLASKIHETAMAKRQHTVELELLERQAEIEQLAARETVVVKQLELKDRIHAQHMTEEQARMKLWLEELEGRTIAAERHATAFTPELVHAVNRLADEAVLRDIAENFSEIAAIEGKGLLETARKFLDFTAISSLPRLAIEPVEDAT